MRILQLSSPRSGTLWLYRILADILDTNNIERRSYIRQHPAYAAGAEWPYHFAGQADVDFLFIKPEGYWARFAGQNYPVADIGAYVRQTRHIRSHSAYCSRCRELFPKLDKIVYLIRDPRDRLLSYANYIFLPERAAIDPGARRGYQDVESYLAGAFAHEMNRWLQEVGVYLQHQAEFNIHVVFYERLLYAFDPEIEGLLAYLGLSLSPQALKTLKADVAFATMKRQHEGHVRQGQAGGWRSSLSPQQKRQAVQIAGPLLALLHYPVDDHQPCDAAHLPSLPDDSDRPQVQAALRVVQPARWHRLKQRFLRRFHGQSTGI
jgi:aryl sulfotransferase